MIRTMRSNLFVAIGCCCCLFLLHAPWVVGAGHDPPPEGRPTQLEDIERDNLNSERQVYKKEAIIQQQHPNGASSSQSNNHYAVQIQHNPGSTAGAHSTVKYVTPLPAPTQTLTYTKDHVVPQHYVNIPQQLPNHHHYQQQQQQLPQQQQVPQVHEDHSTYTVPSRQSLVQPAIGGGAPAAPYLTPQPQYVYVQARPQQLPQYAAEHSLPQSLLHILPQNSQAYIMIPTPYYQQQPPNGPSEPGSVLPSVAPPPSPSPAPPPAPHSAQQLAAYVNDPDNHIQTYSHGETGAQSPVSGPSAVGQPIAQPDVVYAPSSTPAPIRHQSPSAEFSIVKSVEQPVYFSHDLPPNKPNEVPQHQQHVPYVPAPSQFHHPAARPFLTHQHHPHAHHHHHPQAPLLVPDGHHGHYPAYVGPTHSYPPSQFYPSLSHPNNGILNYFGVQQRPPTSLLDSYVPSHLQLGKAPVYTTKLAPHQALPHHPHHHHQVHPHPQRPLAAAFYQPGLPVYPVNPLHTTVLQPAGPLTGALHPGPSVHGPPVGQPLLGQIPSGPATAPGYNTIAYSVPLAYTKTSAQYKRSPGLFSVAGFQRALGLPTTKLQPAKQFA